MRKIFNRIATDFIEGSKIDRAIIVFDIVFFFALAIFATLVFTGVLFPIDYTNINVPEGNFQELAPLTKNAINF